MTPPDASFSDSPGLLRDARLVKIAEVARRDGLIVQETGRDAFRLGIQVPLPSGIIRHFNVVVRVKAGNIGASEDARHARQLPDCCPERHINSDGSFCLYWYEGTEVHADREDGAVEWLNALIAFLQTQIQVEYTREWPAERAWAHGEAAHHQRNAEAIAARIAPRFVRWVKHRRLSVSRTRGGLALLKDGRRLTATVNGSAGQRLINRRGPCPCNRLQRGYLVTIRRCAHERDLIGLIAELRKLQIREKEYLELLRGRKIACCGTVDHCPLRA